ncbi:MAG: membrane protein insertase YidC [Myxococcales bacterium]|nr:membrane protein insertase YidC [Myxococcales bacterium]
MEKRVLLTIAISVAILAGWFFLQTTFFPAPPPPPPVVQAPPAPGSVAPVVPGVPGAPATAAPPAAAPPNRPDEQRITVRRPADPKQEGLFEAVFSTWGAAPVQLTLLTPQYKAPLDGKDQQLNLVRKEAGAPPYTVSFVSTGPDAERSDFELPAEAAWMLLSHTASEIVYAVDVGTVHLEKRWDLSDSGYRLGFALTVENRGAKPVNQHLIVSVTGWQDPAIQLGGFLSFGKRENLTDGECDIAGNVHRLGLESAGCNGGPSHFGAPFAEPGDVKWIGIGEQFFLLAAAFPSGPEARACTVHGDPSGRITTRAVYASRTLLPGAKTEYPMAAFAGPKLVHTLKEVTVGGTDAGLGDAVDYTLPYLALPMLWVLKKIQAVVVNWGLAIIVITILLKAVMFWPTQKSMQSAKRMAKLKPDIDRLKAKHGDDKQAFNTAQMELFKQKGVNPLGGCLPMLLQMPIYIAFYSMLSNAVELYRAAFIGPINDMTAPFWPMAVATGALMFVQQKISPTSPDSQQQKTMMYMMPVMFMMFTLFLPSGLTLYILTNTLLTMAQQWWINRHDLPPPKSAKAPKAAKASKTIGK